MPMKIIPIRFNDEYYKRLHEEKAETGCTIGSQIRMALAEYWRRQDATK